MNFHLEHATTESRDAVVAALTGARDVRGALIDVVSGIVVRTLQASSGQAESRQLIDVRITGAIYGVTEIGTDLEEAARSIMAGTLRATGEAGRSTLEDARASATALTLGAYVVGGDVARAARGAVEGAIDSAGEDGISAAEAASAAARGALEAAAEIDRTSLRQVRRTLSDPICGMMMELHEPRELTFRPEA